MKAHHADSHPARTPTPQVLPRDLLHRVHHAATATGIKLEDLTCELSPAVRAALPDVGSPSTRLLAGLDQLNRMELADGSLPMREALATARLIAGGLAAAAVFNEAIDYVEKQFPQQQPSCSSPALLTTVSRPSNAAAARARTAALVALLTTALLGLIGLMVRILHSDKGSAVPQEHREDSQCPKGRQRYEGACVADKIVDLVVCLRANDALAAVKLADQVILTHGININGAQDDEIRMAIGNSFLALAHEQAEAVRTFCQQAADAANVSVPHDTPDDQRDAGPAPKAGSPATTRLVTVFTNPGCRLSVDGNPVARSTYLTPIEMIPGEHRVTCRWTDEVQESQTVQVKPFERTYSLTFQRDGTGTILLSAPAPGCKFKVDDSFPAKGTTGQVVLPSGTHVVGCEPLGDLTGHYRFVPLSQLVDVLPGRTITANF